MEGKKLKEFFVREGISLTEVAKRMGVSQQNLSSLLSSDNIKTGTLEKVAETFGKSPAFFYTGDNSGTAVVGTANQSTVIGKQDTLGVRAVEKQAEVLGKQAEIIDKQLEVKDKQIETLLQVILQK